MGNAFANILANAAGTTIGLMPSGALRRDIEAGPVRRVDLLDAFPFEDRVAKVTLRGETLLAVLEQGLSLERGFLQVSGLTVTYDLEQPVGSRIKKVLVGKAPLDRDAIYEVATLEIMAQGGDQYTQFEDAVSVEWIDGSFAEHLLAAFIESGSFTSPALGRYQLIE